MFGKTRNNQCLFLQHQIDQNSFQIAIMSFSYIHCIIFFYTVARVIVIPKVAKLYEKSRKLATDTRPTEVEYVVDTMNRYTSKERHARDTQIVEIEMVPMPDSSLVSCVTDTPPTPTTAARKDAIDERKKSNCSCSVL